VILVTWVLTRLVLRSALLIERRLGTTGLNVMTRVMGLLLAAVSAPFIVGGAGDVLPSILARR
jgi:multiple antibiotic resistance protein